MEPVQAVTVGPNQPVIVKHLWIDVEASEVAQAGLPDGDRINVFGRGEIRGLEVVDRRLAALSIEPDGRPFLQPRRSIRNPASYTITFRDCRFRRVRIPAFHPGFARFIDCIFEDIKLSQTGVASVHLENCRFSGRWDCELTAEPDPLDPFATVKVFGNDFSGVSGVDLREPLRNTAG